MKAWNKVRIAVMKLLSTTQSYDYSIQCWVPLGGRSTSTSPSSSPLNATTTSPSPTKPTQSLDGLPLMQKGQGKSESRLNPSPIIKPDLCDIHWCPNQAEMLSVRCAHHNFLLGLGREDWDQQKGITLTIDQNNSRLKYIADQTPYQLPPAVNHLTSTEDTTLDNELTPTTTESSLGSIPNSGLVDSGKRVTYAGGAQRERARLSRYDLLPPFAIRLLAEHFGAGAKKYVDRNWEKGLPLDDFVDSALSHIFSYMDGDRSEPHLSAAIWNLVCYTWTHEEIIWGRLPGSLLGHFERRAVRIQAAKDRQ